MNYGINASSSTDLTALAHRAGAKITGAIQQASAKTGVGFSYLLQQANVESSFKTNAKAATSSAAGLYQFTKSTWLQMIKDHGAEYGLGSYAKEISDNGTVASKSAKQQILALRNDPKISSAMAAEYASDNKDYLQSTVGGEIGSTELYMAHFMGPAGAAKFLSKLQDNPDAIGAKSFADAACTNKSVFYNSSGKPRTLSEIYAFFDNKFDGTNDGTTATSQTQYANVEPLSANAKAALSTATFSNGRADIFDENTGTWSTASKSKDALWSKMAALGNGRIAGLSSAMSNPVDVMQIMELASLHKDNSRYNS